MIGFSSLERLKVRLYFLGVVSDGLLTKNSTTASDERLSTLKETTRVLERFRTSISHGERE